MQEPRRVFVVLVWRTAAHASDGEQQSAEREEKGGSPPVGDVSGPVAAVVPGVVFKARVVVHRCARLIVVEGHVQVPIGAALQTVDGAVERAKRASGKLEWVGC